MKSEQNRISGVVLGAATGLATMFMAIPQLAFAQNWRPEIAATAASEDAPIVITPAARSPVKRQASASDTGSEGAKKAGVTGPAMPEPLMLRPGVEQAKAVVITPLGVGDNRPPMVAAPARRPTREVAKASPAASQPAGSRRTNRGWRARETAMPEAMKVEALTPEVAKAEAVKPQEAKAEEAKAEEILPTAGMSIDPVGAKAPEQVAVAEPAPSPAHLPALEPLGSGDKNHTVIQKSPPQIHQIPAAPKIVASEPAIADAKPESVPAAPQVAATEPETAPAKPEPAAPVPPVVVAEPATAAPQPEPSPAAPVVASAEPEPAPPALLSAGSDPAPSEPVKTEIPVPALDDMDEQPVMLSSTPAKPAAVPAPMLKTAAADKPNARGKGRREAGKDSGAGSAKSKPSKGEAKQAAANAKGKPRPGADNDAPVMITSAASSKAGNPKTPEKPSLAMNAMSADAVHPAAPALPAPITGAPQPELAAPESAAKPEASPTPSVAQDPTPAREKAPMAASASPAQNQPAPPAETLASDEDEPRDPFVDLHLAERRGARGEVLTTQVVPTNTPPEATGQATPVDRTPAAQYCSNIADAAVDARIAWQRQNLAEAEKQIQARTQELEAKTAEYQRWLERRDAFSEKAKKTVVDIYTKMKPDAAALQLAALEEETAAAVIVKLDARSASAVMNEMDPEKAARLTSIISGAAKGPLSKVRRPPAGNRS